MLHHIERSHGRSLVVTAAIALAACAGAAHAQPEYTIRRLGLRDSAHAGEAVPRFLEPNGWAAGLSRRSESPSLWSAWASRNGQTFQMGLVDAAHTGASGLQAADVLAFDHRGIGAGTSRRFAAAGGLSAWIWDRDAGSRRVGLIDVAHTAASGQQFSEPITRISASGRVAGSSNRYLGSSVFGYSAWIADVESAATTRVGFFDAEHTSTLGLQYAQPIAIADDSTVFGFSVRFSGAIPTGRTAWADPIGTGPLNIGLTDAEHTKSGGYKSSSIRAANAQGLAIGTSLRYSGSTSAGTSAWLFDGSSTTHLGFVDAEHTRADGRRASIPRALTTDGFVSGTSARFLTTTNQTGQSAWLYDPGDQSTERIGLFDAEHTRADGLQSAEPRMTLEGGIVGGSSSRYDGMAALGNSIWVRTQAGSTRVNPSDPTHTRADGTQEATLSAMTAFGLAAGTAKRYAGAADAGSSAWIFDPASATTSIVGIFDAVHTFGGVHESTILSLTDTFAIGTTERQTGFDGSTVWFHDIASDATTPLVFASAGDGRYATSVFAATDAGEVIGSYASMADNTLALDRLFIWDAVRGLRDLEGVTEDFAASWDSLTSLAATANGSGLIAGQGDHKGGGGDDNAFLLTRITPGFLPAPSTLTLLAGFGLARRRRIR